MIPLNPLKKFLARSNEVYPENLINMPFFIIVSITVSNSKLIFSFIILKEYNQFS